MMCCDSTKNHWTEAIRKQEEYVMNSCLLRCTFQYENSERMVSEEIFEIIMHNSFVTSTKLVHNDNLNLKEFKVKDFRMSMAKELIKEKLATIDKEENERTNIKH